MLLLSLQIVSNCNIIFKKILSLLYFLNRQNLKTNALEH